MYILYFVWVDQRVQQIYNVHLLYFVWEDQRQKQDFICHKMSSVLYKNTAWWLTNTAKLH